MFDLLLPRRLDNTYRGSRIAVWLLALVLAVKILQALVSMFDARHTAVAADGLPLDAFTIVAVQAVVSLFVLLGRARLMVFLGGVLVMLRYRSAIPLMFLVLLLDDLTARLTLRLAPLPRTGTPPGFLVNLVLLALMVLGLVLSVRGGAQGASRSHGAAPPA
jgi:hypothetical protein